MFNYSNVLVFEMRFWQELNMVHYQQIAWTDSKHYDLTTYGILIIHENKSRPLFKPQNSFILAQL